MTAEQLAYEARKQGFGLCVLTPTVTQTVRLVHGGANTAPALAKAAGIKRTAANMRLSNLVDDGFLVVEPQPGPGPDVYSLTPGMELDWL